MAIYSKRAQVLLTEEQFSLLSLYSKKQRKSIGRVIREAVEKNILAVEQTTRKKEAAERIIKKNLPSVDWQEFKKELASIHANMGVTKRR